jgi:hypothetical protein
MGIDFDLFYHIGGLGYHHLPGGVEKYGGIERYGGGGNERIRKEKLFCTANLDS